MGPKKPFGLVVMVLGSLVGQPGFIIPAVSQETVSTRIITWWCVLVHNEFWITNNVFFFLWVPYLIRLRAQALGWGWGNFLGVQCRCRWFVGLVGGWWLLAPQWAGAPLPDRHSAVWWQEPAAFGWSKWLVWRAFLYASQFLAWTIYSGRAFQSRDVWCKKNIGGNQFLMKESKMPGCYLCST